jgi:hypothetical protein
VGGRTDEGKALKRIYMVLAIAAGCGNSNSNDPSVSFSKPTDGATVAGTFTARVNLDNFTLDAADVGKAPADGKGHLHFSLDNGKYDTPEYSGANGKLAKQLGVDGKYSPAVMPTITYTGIPAGRHTLKVELANNNHSPAGKSATASINVKGDGAASVSFVDGMYSPAVKPAIVYRGIPAGMHTLKVMLANNDHSPTGTQASEQITVR